MMGILVNSLHWCTKRWFYFFCCLGLTSMTWMIYTINSTVSHTSHVSHEQSQFLRTSNQVTEKFDSVISESQQVKDNKQPDHKVENLTVENKALIILYNGKQGSSIPIAMLHSRWKIVIVYYRQARMKPLISDDSHGLFSIIVFEDLRIYMSLPEEERNNIDFYCKRFGVGIIFFTSSIQHTGAHSNVQILNFPLAISTGISIETYTVSKSPVADIAKPLVSHDVKAVGGWIGFHLNHTTYETLCYGKRTANSDDNIAVAVLDLGKLDGVRRIFFGQSHQLWIHKILFLDALAYLTSNALQMEKTKYIQIDIDDMFLGKNGTKMKPADVTAMKNAQAIWRENYVPGFRFYIGFSARSFKKGLQEEQDGDEEIIKQASHFNWFDHTYGHIQVHKYTQLSSVVQQMELSKEFAKTHAIPISSTYSVAPHHSGVYPTDDLLYDAWKKVWNITVTSTEEYPHLKPFYLHRGFVYKNIKVLPRQVCGLYTTNLYYNSYPKGPAALEANILGGDLFDSLLYNYVNIYMTHQQNYASDRLSIYTFDKLFKLFHKATTLKLQAVPPERMAEAYFSKYPKEVDPMWLNPCTDPRHLEIWSPSKQCTSLPSLLIVGPQKTGSTALYTFLKLHPNISSNTDSPTSYEELQFFGSSNYRNGVDWYMNFFKSSSGIKFEKSATYFDKDIVPMQARALLPEAKIIILLLDPVSRAYSWYHHQRAHDDHVALSHSFHEVITNMDKENKPVQSFKFHLLRPGFYYEHIQRWRHYYSDSQIMYLDGEMLKVNPVQVMKEVQEFLQMELTLDYNEVIRFDKEKGFYCVKTKTGRTKCLGEGKGRKREYGEVGKESRMLLENVFATPNSLLKQLLEQVNSPIPAWLASVS